MIYIAHRGNTQGPNPEKENHPDYIRDAVRKGYDVEVDVWLVDGKYTLGHDKPQYEVADHFLENPHFWLHAKDIKTITALIDPGFLVNAFFHETDPCTVTTQKWIWTYPGHPVLGWRSIAVMPEIFPDWDLSQAGGICTDFPIEYQLGKR